MMEGWSFCIGPLGVPTSPKHPKSKTEPSAPPMNLGFIVRVRTPVHWLRFTPISICELSFGKLSWECNTRTTSSPPPESAPSACLFAENLRFRSRAHRLSAKESLFHTTRLSSWLSAWRPACSCIGPHAKARLGQISLFSGAHGAKGSASGHDAARITYMVRHTRADTVTRCRYRKFPG